VSGTAVPRWCRRRGSSAESCIVHRRTSRHGRPSSSRSAERVCRGQGTASGCPSGRTDAAAAGSPPSIHPTHVTHVCGQFIFFTWAASQ